MTSLLVSVEARPTHFMSFNALITLKFLLEFFLPFINLLW
jgi:hypothetical protein